MNLPQFVASVLDILSQFAAFSHPVSARIAFSFYGSLRVVKVVPAASTCDYAGCAKAGWRLRFCAVLSLPLVLNGVESINAFQHEISCWPVHGQKTL